MNQRGLPYVYRVTIVAALGGFLMGFDSAVISGAIPFIKDFLRTDELHTGFIVSCLILGAILGNFIAGPLSDKYGRRTVLFYSAALYIVSAISSAMSNTFWFLTAARIIGGGGVGISLLIAPVYIAEISPASKRGRLVSVNQLNIVIGISTAYFANYFLLELDNNWRWMLGVEALPAVAYFVLLSVIPESPRWLISKNRYDSAKSVLSKLDGDYNADKEFIKIVKSFKNQTNISFRKQLQGFFSKKMRFILFIGLTLGFFQQITGINAILYYAPTIFANTGISNGASFIQAAVIGVVNLLFTILAMFLIDRLGRKTLLILGSFGLTVSLLVLAVFAFLDKFEGYIVLAAMIAYVASFAVSIGPVLWVVLSEIFPNKYRGIGISIAGVWASIISFLVTQFFLWEISRLGTAITFMIYGVFAFLSIIFIMFYVPETKGKSLENIEYLFPRKEKINN